jgi:hypothetical protein
MTRNDFYVYEHWRPDTGQCFYVGKGRGRRARVLSGRIAYHRNIVASLRKSDLKIEIKYIATGLSESDAYALEMERIGFWRDMGVYLINQTGGGNGLRVVSEELRSKLKKRQSERWLSNDARLIAAEKAKRSWRDPEFRRQMSNKLKGRKHSDEHRKKISDALKGRIISEEHRLSLTGRNNPFWGKRHSDELLKQIAEKKRGSRMSEETREKMRKSQAIRRAREASLKPTTHEPIKEKKPRVVSLETREKLRAAAKLRQIPKHVREAQRVAVTGRKRAPFSKETLRRMSEASKLREARKRERVA